MPRLNFGAGALLCALLLASPARAILFDDEELERRLNTLEERISQIEGTMQQLASKLREASAKDQELIDLIRQFQGSIEELGHQIGQQQESNQSVMQDLDAALRTEIEDLAGRLQGLEDSYEAARALSDEEYYELGYAEYQAGSYDKAISNFELLLKHHAASELSANTHYWIGMSNLALERHEDAISTLRGFIEENPRSDRAPEAMLNLAGAYEAVGNSEATKKTLESLVKAYPTSLAADSARQRIKSP